MKNLKIKSSEFVSPGHPDKICDLIADSILDAYLSQDKNSRVAVEVMAGHGQVNLSGEITSQGKVDIIKIVKDIVGLDYQVNCQISPQSPAIAQGVMAGGAGDQGIMVGYACNDNANLIPQEHELARFICSQVYEKYPFDGKVQVTINNKTVETVVLSFQKVKEKDLRSLLKKLVKAENYLINPAGDWQLGGLEADSGLSGRKIVVDAYGPQVPVGGGSFSGKDFTKVDRSAAYLARKIAVNLLTEESANQVFVYLAYAIGIAQAVMANALIDGQARNIINDYDFSPANIRQTLELDKIKYADLSNGGHFGRNMPWDK